MKVKIKNYKKEYQIINHSEVILETRKSKWYSSEINFNYNDKQYKIKKSGFWNISRSIFEIEQPIGKIDFSSMKGGIIRLKNKNETYNEYTLKKEKAGKWYTSARRYVLYNNDLNTVLTIHYDVKFWLGVEDISVSFNDVPSPDFILLVCSLFLMRQQISSENNASATMVG